MSIPDDLRYTKSHEWARIADSGLMSVGITHHAQEMLGDIVFLELPEVGRRVATGEDCAVIESVKAASDIYAPVSGEIAAVNAEAVQHPELINEDAYAAWLFKIKPDDPAEFTGMMDAQAYAQQLEAEQH